MIDLGIDTSGRDGSVALVRGDQNTFDMLEQVSLEGGTYSSQLIPALSAMLRRQELSKPSIEAFAVASGPGSFTGLRVGLSAVKGLSEIFPRPVAAVSVLEAVAAATHENGRVISALDAARKQLYVGEYDVRGGTLHCVRESLMTQMDFSQLLEKNAKAELITVDAGVAELARFHMRVTQIERPGAGEYARLGLRKILGGEIVTSEKLDANYIRRSDAEIFSKPGL